MMDVAVTKTQKAEFLSGREIVPFPKGDKTAEKDLRTDLARAAKDAECPRLLEMLSRKDIAGDFLVSALALSPFLRGIALRRPQYLESLFSSTVDERLEQIFLCAKEAAGGQDATETSLMASLRQLKAEAHFLIAVDDLAGGLAGGVTVDRLSRLAVSMTSAAVGFLLREAHSQGKIILPDTANPGRGSGLVVLAMGKLGAGELNFSSDIDLVVFYDPEAPALRQNKELEEFLPRLIRRLVRLLQERTSDGYVFRTDLRLRPDPGSTPLAIPVEAALNYYESRGQNWERAAFIKANPIAGDIAAGEKFLEELVPFIWRKYLDYAAIADVHSIKRQIHAHKGHGEIAVKGHNVKLGRGGIREIEFFVQTQQLIAGGRFLTLRGKRTVDMIGELAERGWIDAGARDALIASYWYLRDVENRLQIIADEQTHILPEDDPSLARFARMMREKNVESFADTFRSVLKTVERHYAALFEEAPQLSTGLGNLVFTGDVDDPGTLETLSNLGFKRPSDMSRMIRTWHFGRYRATSSAVAREVLTELTPLLLETFGRTGRADEALLRFDAFLAGLPAGIQLFSLLRNNPSLLELLATIMSAAPRLADIITRRAHVFDGLLDPSLMSELPNRAYLEGRLTAFLLGADIYEEVLDRLRIFAAEQKFLIGIRLLTGAIDAVRAGKAFSDVAELTIGKAFDAVCVEFAKRHGHVAGARAAILGMGKLGSRELSAASDVDLILLYDHAESAEESDGEKPLAPSHYFIRLTQRLIAAVSAPTAEGVLYEIDMRLRPSGNKGPVATHIESFRKYQRDDAWTWEHMALTRARTIAGDENFRGEVDAEIDGIIAMPRDTSKIIGDAVKMRRMILKEKPPRDHWDLKLVDGGLIDIEFIAQVASLCGFVSASSRTPSTIDTIAHLSDDFADAQTREELLAALKLYTQFLQTARLCLDGPFSEREIPQGFADLLLRQTGHPDLGVLAAHLDESAKQVRKSFRNLLGGKRGAG